MICCHQVTFFSAWGTEFPVRLLQGSLVILVPLQTGVKSSLMPFSCDVPNPCHEKYLRAQVLLRSRGVSAKSSSPSGIPSPLRFPATPLPQSSVVSSLLRVLAGSNEIDGRWSCGAVELDDSTGTTNGTKFSVLQKAWFQLLVRRGFTATWAIHKCNSAICKACQKTIRHEYLLATAQRRKCEDHAHRHAGLHSSGPPHWLSPLLWEI